MFETDDSYVESELIYYQNIGVVRIKKPIFGPNTYRVEINDIAGNYLYWVFTYTQSQADRLVDALNLLKGNALNRQ